MMGPKMHSMVSLTGSLDYITISNQTITRNAIDLTTDVTGALPIANGGTNATSAADARTNLGLVIGTDVQAFDATLQSISSLGTIANRMIYTTGVDTWAEASITAFGRSLVAAANDVAGQIVLGLVAGGTGDIWVEKAGDTMTGALVIDGSADTNQLRIQGNGTQTNNILLIENSGGTDLMWVDNNGRVTTVASASGGFAVDGLVINHTGTLATITNSTGSLSIEGVATNEIVINNLAADVNFRVEADNNPNILMVDAGINNATGGVGIGTNAQNDNRLYVSWANDQDINLKGISIDVSQTVAFTKTLRGMNVTANFSGTSGTMTGVNALEFDVRASGNGGTISTAQGVSANANVSTGATITNLYLMRLFNATNSGTIGTVEALRIEDQTQFGATTSNAIHTFGGGVIFNDNGRDSDFRIEGDNESNLFYLDASVDAIGVGISTPGARLHIDQSSTTAAKPVLTVDQADVSEEFIRFIGSSANTVLTQSIVEAADVGTATVAGYLKVFVQDDGNQLTDQAYFLAIYTLA